MFPSILRTIDEVTEHLTDASERLIKASLEPLAAYLRKLSIGVVIVIVSSVAWSTTVVLLLLTLFFAVSPLTRYALPCLYTMGASVVVALVTMLSGLALLKRPRQS